MFTCTGSSGVVVIGGLGVTNVPTVSDSGILVAWFDGAFEYECEMFWFCG